MPPTTRGPGSEAAAPFRAPFPRAVAGQPAYAGRVGQDAELLSRLRSGEPAAFEELVRTYGGRLRAVALRLTIDEAEADDVLQDAFLSAFRSLDGFDGRADVGTWLHRIVINAALMKLRSRGRSGQTDLGQLLPEFLDTGVFATRQDSWEEPADEPAIRRELLEQVHANIERLPDKHRVPVVLRDLEDLPFHEIAELLETTVGNARLRVHRARQALRTLLEPLF